VIPAAFEYRRADSAQEAISLVGEFGEDAKLLAGGHSLLPLMKLRLAQPSVLIDIGRLSDLSYIRDEGDTIVIGALTRHRDVEMSPLLIEHVPLLAHAASHVGDPQVRHRGTIGGSIAHADPASDLPATTLALGASYVLEGPAGTRTVAAADFYQGFLESVLAADEVLTEIRIPKMGDAGWGFHKFNRRAQDWRSSVSPPGGAATTPVSLSSTWAPPRSWPAPSPTPWPPGPASTKPPNTPATTPNPKTTSTPAANTAPTSPTSSPAAPSPTPPTDRVQSGETRK